jgi:hypothetical protein
MKKQDFLPVGVSNLPIDKITYVLDLNGVTNYSGIGFTNEDIKFEKSNFKNTFLNLSFYDTDNSLDQRLVMNTTLFSALKTEDLTSSGKVKVASEILLTFSVENPILNPRGFAEGYHLYDYKDGLKLGETKYLYMRVVLKC